MATSRLVARKYQPGEWRREKIEARWHFFSLPGMTIPVGFHEDDATYEQDGSLTLRADKMQWKSFDYLAEEG